LEYFIIAEREMVIAFSLAGVPGKTVVNREEALAAFNHVTGSGGVAQVERPKVLLVTEEVSIMLEQELFAWQMKSTYPLVVEIPGIHGHLEGKKTLTDAIREAVGIHI
jgi:V/A-type H+-transporting ATPase subunit F